MIKKFVKAKNEIKQLKQSPQTQEQFAYDRKLSVVIDAIQWFKNGDHPEDNCVDLISMKGEKFKTEGLVVRYFRHPDISGESECLKCGHTMHVHGWVGTLESCHCVCPGDFIIKDANGEFYPCKPDIFNMTYEIIGEE